MSEEKQRVSAEVSRTPTSSVLPTINPTAEKQEPTKISLHPALYVVAWMTMSSTVILFNKWILDTKKFHYPIILTTWHLAFGTLMSQILARTTTLLDGRKKFKMTGKIYLRAIVPIGLFFSLSLICGNLTYLYLSVAFIQMLKATTPVAVLFATWGLGTAQPNLKILFNVSFIVAGVVIATFGEIEFVFIGFIYQLGGIVFEAIRLALIERLLSSAEFKMDPLVSFYYFAPVCAVMNGVIALIFEFPKVQLADFARVGYGTLLINGLIAFGLNLCLVALIGKTSSLVLTLCGVLKDVILVAASMVIFGTPVSPLQFLGYSIALGGMVYYKLGADSIKAFVAEMGRQWQDFGAKRPVLRKILLFIGVVMFLLMMMGWLAPTVGYDTATVAQQGKDLISGALRNKDGRVPEA